jgi:two-component system, NtrC family, nitrogen regulation sensor histidine kinase GlnL
LCSSSSKPRSSIPTGRLRGRGLRAAAEVTTTLPRAEYLENLTTGVVLLGAGLEVRYANPAAEQLLGVSRLQLAGRVLTDVVPGLDVLVPLLERVRDTGQGFSRREVLVAAPPAGEPGLALDCALTTSESTTGTRELLLEMADASRRLRIDREKALLAQLEASRSMVRQLAHELRNPLGGIRGAAQLLSRQLETPAQTDYTSLIIREADRLVALTSALLGPVRAPQKTLSNIHEYLEHVHQLVVAEAASEIHVERDYDPSLPPILLDGDLVIQAMLNLARNALAALEGRGRIIFRTRVLTNETIGHRRCRLGACVEIEDDGPGVPEELRETLFYPLVTGRPGGSGLGLAVAQELVSRHDGLIEYSSRPGRTVFRMLFPITEENS